MDDTRLTRSCESFAFWLQGAALVAEETGRRLQIGGRAFRWLLSRLDVRRRKHIAIGLSLLHLVMPNLRCSVFQGVWQNFGTYTPSAAHA